MMKRKIIIAIGVLVLLVIAYWVGHGRGSAAAEWEQAQRDMKLHEDLVALDRSFLAGLATKPGSLTSGTYVLETQFAGKPAIRTLVKVTYRNGQSLELTGLPSQDIFNVVCQGAVVSWDCGNMSAEGPFATYVGLVDGSVMWGRVYQGPGQGWREGEPPAYGVWKLSPKADDSKE
jgi:hypothetical protein